MQQGPDTAESQTLPNTPNEVLRVFTRLGLTAFGGPIAHLAYLRRELVERQRWVTDSDFLDLVAMCQFLPGPASSQLGIAFGLMRAGAWGALAAWAGFTLPSACALLVFAFALHRWQIAPDAAWLHGLRIAAAAIVTQTVWVLASIHLRGLARQLIALFATVLVVAWSSIAAPVAAILVAGLIGWQRFGHGATFDAVARPLDFPISRRASLACLTMFLILFLGLPILHQIVPNSATAVAAGFFWAGTFVFDGGPGALPVLHETVVTPGWVSNQQFLTGFAAAEAMPGPLLTFSGFLGVSLWNAWWGGIFALIATFLPSTLIILGALPFWHHVHRWQGAPGALQGINAAVVGILLAALYRPIWSTAILVPSDAFLAASAMALLAVLRWPPVVIVILCALVSMVTAR